MTAIQGLSHSEVITRRERGEGNNIKIDTSRTYRDIVTQNVFNLINIVLFTIGAVMIAIGRPGDAVTSVGLIVLNVIIGMYQEIRAKRQLDKIALLTRPSVSVLRDGAEARIDPGEIVLGDTIVLRPGDQAVVDGVMVDGKMEVDESQLTGESDLIDKQAGDELLSGSFCVAGTGMYEATKVGAESFANKLTARARSQRVMKTPLQRDIDFVIRVLMFIAMFIGFLMLTSAVLYALPLMRSVQMAGVIAGLIPNGLFFMVIVAYAMGALRIAGRGALIQQANSVESLSNVNVLCMDKTGTLTANKINFHDVYAVGMDKAKLLNALGVYGRSASVTNRTGEAIVEGIPGEAHEPVDEVPFFSARKWSALAFDGSSDAALRGVYVLGALEMLKPYLKPGPSFDKQVKTWSDAGLRVLLFAHNPDVTALHGPDGQTALPALDAVGVISFSDELRPEARETLAGFIQAGIRLKVISGDNPQTVVALAKQAGLPGPIEAISGPELATMDNGQFEQMAEEATIFGRITPEQKEHLVDSLRKRGYYVAMIGDGVNDVLSLKKANLGIAMNSGSAATRGVADIVLVDDSFGALPPAFLEGQRILNGMKDILRLFLTRAVYSALLIVATAIMNIGFPFVPKHSAMLAAFTVGIPTFALAVWARPGHKPKEGLLRSVMHFIMPASITIFFFGLLAYLTGYFLSMSDVDMTSFYVSPDQLEAFRAATGINYDITTSAAFARELGQFFGQASLTTFTLLAGLVLIVFVEPPTPWFVAGDTYSGDMRPTYLAIALFIGFIAIMVIEPLRSFFEMPIMPAYAYVIIGLAVVVWALMLRYAWRASLFERFLNLAPVYLHEDEPR